MVVNELRDLEKNGIVLKINNVEKNFFVNLIGIAGDN